MIAWLWKFLIGDFRQSSPPCEHSWVILKKGQWEDIGMGTGGDYYTLQCKECGDIKGRKA